MSMKLLPGTLIALLFLIVACTNDTNILNSNQQSTISLQVTFKDVVTPEGNLTKPGVVDKVVVRVSAPDLPEQVHNLNLSNDGKSATGSFTVPKGNSRKFVVQGINQQSNIVQFEGETTKNLTNDQETISITAAWKNVDVELHISFPANPFMNNVTTVTAIIAGAGLQQPKVVNIPFNGDQTGTALILPVGQKNITVMGSVDKGPIRIDLFEGVANVNLTQTTGIIDVAMNEKTDTRQPFAWHDGTAEDFVFLPLDGILAMGFNVSQPVFIVGVDFFFRWQGNPGDYRIVVLDANLQPIFTSGNPIPPGVDDWNTWQIVWNNPADGVIASGEDVFVGFLYDTDFGYPEIGYDMTNPSQNSVFFDPSQQQWFFDTGGDYLITAIVQTPAGQKMYVTPDGVFNSKLAYDNWKHHVTEKQR